jgi:small subunit ribosomal protein S4
MGHPRRISKKYSAPKHPWRAERIQEEKGIGKTYGLKNKKEIWKAHAYLRAIRQQARTLLAKKTPQSNVEKTQLIDRLVRLGLMKPDEGIDDILVLTTTDILNRRLQTLVHKLGLASTISQARGLASTISQARQLISHGHVMIKGTKVTSPSYLVLAQEEKHIALSSDFQILAPENVKEVKSNG